MSTPTDNLNLRGVLSESMCIINAHSRHFLTLSLLFLLPLSFSLIIYPTLQATLSQPNSIFHHHELLFLSYTSPHSNTPPPHQSILLLLLLSLFVLFLSLCAMGTIAYSTIQGFYGRPVKIVSSLKSLVFSFIPLCFTAIVIEFLMFLVVFVFLIFAGLVWKGVEFMGFEVSFGSMYVTWGVILLGLIGLVLLMWLQVNWLLAFVIVVVESKWGYEALRRSAYLIKGMRGVAFSMMVLFAVLNLIFAWSFWTPPMANSGGLSEWKSWMFIIQTVGSSIVLTYLMLRSMAANAVLYMYCKALHGELALEIVEEFAHEYVSLPFDDDKVPHVVSVV